MHISSLQIWLALAGAVLLLAVALHGVWVSRRHAPRQASNDNDNPAASSGEGVEPALDAAAFELSHFPLPLPEKKPLLDALIDVLASINLDNPVSGDAALAAMPPLPSCRHVELCTIGRTKRRHGGIPPFTVCRVNTSPLFDK